MTSLSFPDINVWFALVAHQHVQHIVARRWWDAETSAIVFSRITQIGLLRLMTTAAAMYDKPLTMAEAWSVHDRLFEDERVAFLTEPVGIEEKLRRNTAGSTASPKLWTDAYLAAFAEQGGGSLVTFDRALAIRVPKSRLLA